MAAAIKLEHIGSKRKPPTWVTTLNGQQYDVVAWSKSEARAALKNATGMPLPEGLTITKQRGN